MLNLDQLQQVGLVEKDDEYEITAACVTEVPQCLCLTPDVVRNGTKLMWYQDTPMHGKRVSIGVKRQRYKCRNCNATLYADVPHMHEKHRLTDRCFRYLTRNGAIRSWKALGDELGLTAQTVADIWNAWADAELAKLTPVTPDWLGIDELYIMGKYRAIITNVKHRALVNMLPNRDFGTLYAFFTEKLDPSAVQVVTMDMWDPYRQVVKATFPNAKIVVDRFHVMMYASKAVEAARKSIRSQLNKQKRVGLLGDRWLFLTARENLSAMQTATLEAVLEQYPVIRDAYRLKEEFRDVWKADNRAVAEAQLHVWLTHVAASPCVDVFKPLVTALGNWREEIFGYMDWKLTNAYTESFNALARRMDNVGRGYSFEGLRKRLMMTHCLHVRDVPPPPQRVSGDSVIINNVRSLIIREDVSSTPYTPPKPVWKRWVGLDLSTLAEWSEHLPDLS